MRDRDTHERPRDTQRETETHAHISDANPERRDTKGQAERNAHKETEETEERSGETYTQKEEQGVRGMVSSSGRRID